MTREEDDGGSPPARQIEWDENKRRTNLAKHGIDFLDAVEIFSDPRQQTISSQRLSDERRHVTLGILRGRVVALIWTMRGDKLRVISMRYARHGERKHYEEAT